VTCHHPTSWITSLGLCVCGEAVEQRHVHILVKDQLGQDVCSVCHQVVINPIFSSDDPRLQPPEIFYRLPDVLVTLYYEGPEYGLPRAPIAPYVRDIAEFEGQINRYDPQDLWDILAELV
jgi:hypothetical protein